jgi:hypothetical protein
MSRPRVEYEGDDPDYRVIRSTFRDPEGPVGRMLDRKSRAVLQEVQRTVPVRTGRLLASARRSFGESERGVFWDVTIGVPGVTDYLSYILNGTPPHTIRPRRRKALRFIGRGGVVFAKVVHHPGTRARPFMQKALEKARDN